jgi:16S rRNA (cytosine967-C5)-methyltransferase
MTALSEQLTVSAKAVSLVMAGRSLSDVLADGAVVKPLMRPGVQALTFAVLRYWGLAVALRARLADRPPPPAVDALLCTVLALFVSDSGPAAQGTASQGTNYTDFTLVNQAVEAAKANAKTRTSSAFINAILRRFLRERAALTAAAQQEESALWNHPQWWIDQLRQEQPQHWQAILSSHQVQPPLTLRVNVAKTNRTAYAELLAEQGIAAELVPAMALEAKRVEASGREVLQANQYAACGLMIRSAVPVMQLPRFKEGFVSVQDAAAQGAAKQLLSDSFLAALVARAQAGEKIRILDACAAPGGKTTHLIELLTQAFQAAGLPVTKADGVAFEAMPFAVLALEQDAKRAKRIHDNLARLGQRATVKIADAGLLDEWWTGEPLDAILLDAPCTASGIVRRHPDVRWLRRPTDAVELSSQQLRLLRALWPTLAVGGRLLYATCSVWHAEGAGVIRQFTALQPQAKWLDSQGLWLPSADNDGFYDALLEKQS